MRNNLILISVFLIFSCQKKSEYKVFDGFYFNKNKMEFYQFKYNIITKYNFLDSSITKYNFKIKNKNLQIDGVSYSFDNFKGDSTYIHNFERKNKNLTLQKFKYKNLNLEELNGSEWKAINKDSLKLSSYIKIDGQKGILNFFKHKGDKGAIMTSNINYASKVFDKFHTYNGTYFCALVNINKEKKTMHMICGQANKASLYTYTRINTTKINNELQGKWKKVNDSIFQNKLTKYNYEKLIEPFFKNENKKNDSLKKLIDYSNIEFTHDGYLIRRISNTNDSILIKRKVSYNNLTNYLFTNDLIFIEDEGTLIEQNQYFKILKLTKDTLKIKISNPNFLYIYTRK
ncbi:hypothetical protein [uncultured Tenacibaculum sp.]|uniref:hypothetical protein n=1 Tax=uncultured Tenacibaculum sp. TaxID=174713 RepID=UPI00262887D3|nr:hypothetical protein [uncultured Tenacibaculum sp.]